MNFCIRVSREGWFLENSSVSNKGIRSLQYSLIDWCRQWTLEQYLGIYNGKSGTLKIDFTLLCTVSVTNIGRTTYSCIYGGEISIEKTEGIISHETMFLSSILLIKVSPSVSF